MPKEDARWKPKPKSSARSAGEVGLVTLNRPQALNALTLGMVREMRRALDAWDADPTVTRIVVQGAGEKAFCAGGDIRRLTELGLAGPDARRRWPSGARNTSSTPSSRTIPSRTSPSSTASSWAAASACRCTAATGWRASVTCSPCRRSAIGFFPDVGATYALPRLPGRMGRYIALTGERIKRADAMMLGLATHAVGGADFDALIDHLTAGEAGRAGLGDFRGRSRRGAACPARRR